jgi:oxygen-independent coproporphyrinogen-3 oxidase
LSLQLLQRAISSFTSSSLERYEISAFAKNGYYSRHNVGYWIGRPFLGLGPSAFSYEGGRRFQNSANLQQYYQLLNSGQAATVFAETLPFDQKLTELFLMELRLIQGVQMELFQEKHGKIPKEMEEQLKKLTCEGWLEKKQEALCLSKKGLLFYDSVAESLL